MAHCRLSKRQKRTKTHPAKLLVMCHCLTLKTVSEMSTEININGLLEKPLWQMTGEEYRQLTQYALSLSKLAECTWTVAAAAGGGEGGGE